MLNNSYRMKLRTSTLKKTAATMAGLRPQNQKRLRAISGVAPPTNIFEPTPKIHFNRTFTDPEDVDMDSGENLDNVVHDDDKMVLSPVAKKASRAADKAPRKFDGARRRRSQAPVTPTQGGPSRIVHSTPRRRRLSRNPPKAPISSSTVLSTPTQLPRPIERHNAQTIIKSTDLLTYPGTPSLERKPMFQMRPEVVYKTPTFDPSAIQAREVEVLTRRTKEINDNVRLAQDLMQNNPAEGEILYNPQGSVPGGSRLKRFSSQGTELCDE